MLRPMPLTTKLAMSGEAAVKNEWNAGRIAVYQNKVQVVSVHRTFFENRSTKQMKKQQSLKQVLYTLSTEMIKDGLLQ